jgi:DNA-binding transcriptional ArsR family regulator
VRFVTSDLQVLVGLEAGARQYQDLTDRTGLARSTVSRSVTRLSDHGIVEQHQDGRAMTVRPGPTSVVDGIGAVRESAPQLGLQEFLTMARLRVLWFLTAPRTASEIAQFTDVGETRARQVLAELRRRQIATETETGVRLRPKYEPLQSLAESVFDVFHTAEIKTELPESTVVWTAPHEALFTAPSFDGADSLDGTVTQTGLDQFTQWGLEFRSSSTPLYYRSTRSEKTTLTAMDVIVHTLCRQVDNRRAEYSAVLLAEAVTNGTFSQDRFLRLVDHYDVEEVGQYLPPLIVASAESEKAGRRRTSRRETSVATSSGEPRESTLIRSLFPSPRRVRDTAGQYDVDISKAGEGLRDAVDGSLLKEVKIRT